MNDLISLNTLFNSKLFRIPDYQRGYSWNHQQLEDFWSDLFNLRSEKVHYTGMISLKKLTKEETKDWDNEEWLLEEDYSAYHVVDGQQRLTTIIILINEIVNYYRSISKDENGNQLDDDLIYIKKTRLSDVVEKYLYKIDTSSPIKTKTYKFGYEVDNPSYEFFKHKILGEKLSGELEETFYTLNLEYAKKFFYDKVHSVNGSVLEEIYKKLTQYMQFNIYYIDDDFNVFMAFETMNNRGKPLSYLELLKNRLIYLSTLFDEKPSQKNIVRDNIMDSLKGVYTYLGKNKNNPLQDNEFLQNHWMIYFKYTRSNKITYNSFLLNDYFNEKNIYDNFDNYVEQDQYEDTDDDDIIEISEEQNKTLNVDNKHKLTLSEINDYVLSLKDIATYCYRLYNPSDEPNKEIRNYLERLNILGFANFKPLITVLLSKDSIQDEKKIEALKAMERFVFIYHRLSGISGTAKNSYFYGLAHKLYYDEIDIDVLISEINKMDIISSNNVISSLGVLNKINTLFNGNNFGFYSWATLRYLLYEYEKHLISGQGTIKLLPEDYFKADDKDTCSIEHIYPQTPEDEYWINQFVDYNDDEKYRLTGSLGNLLPLSKAINSSFQNDPFEQKKNGTDRRERCYANGCYSEIEVSKVQDWDAEEILKRGLKIVDFMEHEWNFHFTNRAEKIKFLGLDFMIKDDDYKNDEYIPIIIKEEKEKEIYNDVDDLLYLIMDNEEYASGYYKNGKIIVKAGSKIRPIESPKASMREKVEKGRQNANIVNGVFVADTVYDNPSYAANIILGNNKNGWTNWKNKAGETLNDLSGRSSFNEDRLFKKSNEEVINTYNYLKKKLMDYSDDIKTRYVNNYVAFYIDNNFIEIHPQKEFLVCYTVNKDNEYPNVDTQRVPESNGWAVDTKFSLRSTDELNDYWNVIVDSINNTTK